MRSLRTIVAIVALVSAMPFVAAAPCHGDQLSRELATGQSLQADAVACRFDEPMVEAYHVAARAYADDPVTGSGAGAQAWSMQWNWAEGAEAVDMEWHSVAVYAYSGPLLTGFVVYASEGTYGDQDLGLVLVRVFQGDSYHEVATPLP